MKKSSVYLVLFVFLLAICSAVSFSQEVDLTGTWEGSTIVPDQGEDELTLVIQKEEDEYVATMSDSLGMLMDTECEEIEFEDGTLTFSISISQGMETFTVWFTLEVEGDTMKGYWETAEGDQGDVELKKQ
ncbi:MAG: hypothetical protein JSV17_01125 [Candidatus Aminicenantes bacterium]|nr:MAG: hypothetical protein JSV17_01125 [Candidatus Aminicenantes bacterium]